MHVHQNFASVKAVSPELIERFLAPYKENCRYLKRAQIQFSETNQTRDTWSIGGDFAIPESCYIDDTGHFNSVEFNICYNQLFYIAIAYAIQNKLLKALDDWDLDTFKRRQLSDFLIVKFFSTFKQPIDSDSFQGTLSIERCSVRSNLILLKTSCAFYDQKGRSEGEVTIAILNDKFNQAADLQQTVVSLP